MKSISVVICAYNEENNVQGVILDTVNLLEKNSIDYEIIVIDDGSIDGTLKKIEELAAANGNIRVIVHKENQGMGMALLHGFEASGKEWVTFLPADGQIAPDDVISLARHMDDHNMVVSYYLERKSSFYRRITSGGIRFLYFIFFGPLPRLDGTYMFERRMLTSISLKMVKSFFINYEFLIKAKRMSYKIKEIPTVCLERKSGASKVSSLRKVFFVLCQIIEFRFKYY